MTGVIEEVDIGRDVMQINVRKTNYKFMVYVYDINLAQP